jgi:phage terminase large subunit
MMTNTDISAKLAQWREHPAIMVWELFEVEPDAWQEETLERFPHSPRMCLKACTGPGKTAVLAWLGWNFLLTRPHPIVGATSISQDNLRANLWTELSRWHGKSMLLQHQFEQTKTAIFHKEHPKTWKIEARTWAKDADPTQIGNALRGLHAPYVMWLLDESGDYPNAIMPVAEAIFSGNPIEAHIVQAGNPLKLSGPLYQACTTARHLWRVIEITADPDDPKRTPRVSIEHAREQIRLYGRENPWVLVNIFGRFPPSSINSLIGPDEVAASQKRFYREHEIGSAAKILGVDVARFGHAKSVICPRQGLQCFPLMQYRNVNSTQGAGQVARKWNDWGADACFIDATGGFGAGWLDQLYALGKTPMGVQFAGEAHRKDRYFNKRAEMYFEAVDWIKRGGALPPSDELLAALTQTTYTFRGDRFLLEPKEDIEARLGFSLDDADAFVLTFAEEVTPRASERAVTRSAVPHEYHPFHDMDNGRGRW